MNKNMRSLKPVKRWYLGTMIMIVAILFSTVAVAQKNAFQQKNNATKQTPPQTQPVRRQEAQPPRQNNPVQHNQQSRPVPVREDPQKPRPKQLENNQPKTVPVKPVNQEPRTVRPDEPIQDPKQDVDQPKAVPVNPVKHEPRTLRPDEPLKDPKQDNVPPNAVPVKPFKHEPGTVKPIEPAPKQNANTQVPVNTVTTAAPVRVAPPPPNYVRPVYNAHNPSWRYSHLPRWHSYVNTVPAGYRTIRYRNYDYRYCNGVFYQPYNNSYMIISAPYGMYLDMLPYGYSQFYVSNHPYYYYNGNYFDYRDNYYYVVSPPVGALVESLPNGYETIVIDGETYYEADGAQYKPVLQDNGEIWYEVIKANN
ncbi:MAG: DUF6515 family protein [Ferruginibacter sp.]